MRLKKVVNDGDVLIWKKTQTPIESPTRPLAPDDDYTPKMVADLNYHDSEFFTKLEEAINGR
jgi:hypothetical protein